MNFIAYLFIQTAHNLKHTWGTQVLTMLTVGLSVLFFSFFLLIYTNMHSAGLRLGNELRLIIYLDEEPVPEMLRQLKSKINQYSDVKKIEYIDKKMAFQRLKVQMKNAPQVLDDLDKDFLPPSIEVYPSNDLNNLSEIKHFSNFLETLPGTSKIQYGQEWVEKFHYFIKLLRIVVILSGSLLALTTVLMVSYTIRLTLVARRDELEILRLLGATNSYIQAPLIIEGLLQGLVGSATGLVTLYILFGSIKVNFLNSELFNIFQFDFFTSSLLATVLLISIVLCAGGAIISTRRCLQI
jgi:cell division transport system permease protein